jgi:hypothetical protein
MLCDVFFGVSSNSKSIHCASRTNKSIVSATIIEPEKRFATASPSRFEMLHSPRFYETMQPRSVVWHNF